MTPSALPAKASVRILATAGAMMLAGAAAVMYLPAARADSPFLQLSLDGSTFATSLNAPIFNQDISIVPGSTEQASLWVRNNSSEQATLSSAAVMISADPELTGYLGLRAGTAASTGSTRVGLGEQGSCTDLPGHWDIAPQSAVKIDLALDLSFDAPNETRNRTAGTSQGDGRDFPVDGADLVLDRRDGAD